jgi:hypothetical protein
MFGLFVLLYGAHFYDTSAVKWGAGIALPSIVVMKMSFDSLMNKKD